MDQPRLLMVGITIMIYFVWNGCLMKLLSMMLSNFGSGYSGALYETARSMVRVRFKSKANKNAQGGILLVLPPPLRRRARH